MPPVLIAIVKGGLGNQLFIYAAARALALRTGRRLYLDTKRGYTNDNYGRGYRLNRFPIQAEPMPEGWRVAAHLKHPRHKIIRGLNKLLPRDFRSYLAERRRLGPEQLTALKPQRERITLLGYWQNEAYFADCATAIRAELDPPAPSDERNLALGEKFSTTDSVLVHFRRARYWNLLWIDYYQPAVDAVFTKIAKPRFVLFGDDLNWPRQNLNFHDAEVEYITHNGEDELADLWLMSRCRHAVVANSSFSWWGAWLGGATPGRIIFAPQSVGFPIVMPESWQRIANTVNPMTT